MVYAGSLCRENAAQLRVLRIGSDTRLSQLTRAVEKAQGQRPRVARLADVVASRMVVALFLGLAAVDHFSVGTFWRKRYEADVTRGVNPVRWTEYSISASLMIVLIAMLAGVTNVVALLAIFGVNAAMILFGLVMERLNLDRTEVDWTPFIFGSILGALPWILIAIQFALSESEAAGVPGFVYGIFVSLFILFNGFAINMWLTYRGNGHWKDPLFAERVYIMLSFVAKTALAWQVYAGALAGS